MIIKIQLPLSTNEPTPLALIYNKSRKFYVQYPVDDELLKLMTMDERPEPKLFFKAHLDKNNYLVIEDYAKWQEW